MDELVRALLERETLDRDEFLAIMGGAKSTDLPAFEPDSADTPSEQIEESEAPTQPIAPPRFEPGTA
jgi:hypothetical protein